MTLPVDHLLYGVPNLEEGIQHIHKLTGVKPIIGGSHPGLGTRNALLGLGNGIYLEIIAPDPDQEVELLWMNLDRLEQPKLFRWAAFSNELDQLRAEALAHGMDIGQINAGQRKTPEGNLLSWKLSNPNIMHADGVIPFFIDWGTTGNPSPTLPSGCQLTSFQAQHPEPEGVIQQLDHLGIDLKVDKGIKPQLIAEISTPNGLVILQ